jgi:hypothetical protein
LLIKYDFNLQSSDKASLEALAEQLAGLSVTVKARALLPSTSTTPHPSPSQAIKKVKKIAEFFIIVVFGFILYVKALKTTSISDFFLS